MNSVFYQKIISCQFISVQSQIINGEIIHTHFRCRRIIVILHLRALLIQQHDTHKLLCKAAWKFQT